MKSESTLEYDGLRCQCYRPADAQKAAYILYPMDTVPSWTAKAAEKYGVAIVIFSGMDWDNDLTPWAAPGQPKDSPHFEGLAKPFLDKLTRAVIPDIEKRLGFTTEPERSLIGVSLSGLFALWQWPQSDFFANIATLSGSFWYVGFTQWIFSKSFAGKTGKCFMLLGQDEPHTRNAVFATVGKCTEEIVGYLHRQGVDVTYDIVPGDHYQYPDQRMEMALSHLFSPQ